MARWERRDGRGFLGESQQRRYERHGISESDYRSGKNLQKARGHKDTPEHPGRGNPARSRARDFASLTPEERSDVWEDVADEGPEFWEEYEDVTA
jgi:hypothetical protein